MTSRIGWALRVGGVALVALALSAAPSSAGLIINFDQFLVPASGVLSYDGAGGPLVGTGIQFDTVRLIDDVSNTVLAFVQCAVPGDPCMRLDFQTGLNTAENVPGNTYAWGSTPVGGDPANLFFNVTLVTPGGILALPAGTLLLAGDVGSASFAPESGTLRANVSGLDVKDQTLLNFLFFPNTPPSDFRYLNSETIVNVANYNQDPVTGAFTALPTNADIDNIAAIPEPGSAILLLLGLGSLAAYRRRN